MGECFTYGRLPVAARQVSARLSLTKRSNACVSRTNRIGMCALDIQANNILLGKEDIGTAVIGVESA